MDQVKDTIPDDDRTNSFYDSLRTRAYKNRWTMELHNIIIVPPKKKDQDLTGSQRTIDDYLPFEGKIINNISFMRLDPFGTSLWDTAYSNINTFTRFGNALHFKTLERVLQRHIILEKGERLDPYKVADNERLIRELKYVEDVRIMIRQEDPESDLVDIIIITKDIWSKAFFMELQELDAGSFGFWDRNIFGTGNDFENNIHWNPGKSDFWGYDAIYKSRNILGTFINSSIFYKNVFETESYGFTVDRKFYTPSTKYAGGISYLKKRTVENIWYSQNLQTKEPLNFSILDFWLGRSFELNKNAVDRMKRINLILASRLTGNNFTTRPAAVSEDLFFEYHNNIIWLNSVSLTARAYYRSNLIYSFGRTEDIPNGWMSSLTFGKEFSEFNDRLYVAMKLAHGNFIGNLGYVYTSYSLGSFIADPGQYQQGISDLKLNYFTNLFIFGRYKFRHFINFEYLKGIDRFELERININDKNGIRGLTAGGIYGQQKLTMNMESVLFAPSILYGFRFAFFGFVDFALIGDQYSAVSELDNFNGVGFGIRIRNERLVFPTFQFRFAFYPGLENIDPVDYFKFSGEKKLNPEDFSPGAPDLIKFQ